MDARAVTNMEAGNLWTARILGNLYAAWPEPLSIDWMTICVQTKVDPEGDMEAVFQGLMSWLEKEGYLRYEHHYDVGQYEDVTLTEKSMVVLRGKPSAVEPSLGKQLQESLGDTLKAGGKDAVSSLITTILTVGATTLWAMKP